MLRAAFKSNGLKILFGEINEILKKYPDQKLKEVNNRLQSFYNELTAMASDEMQLNAKYFFESLAQLYQVCLLYKNKDEESEKWISPAIDCLKQKYFGEMISKKTCISPEKVKDMIAWIF